MLPSMVTSWAIMDGPELLGLSVPLVEVFERLKIILYSPKIVRVDHPAINTCFIV